MHPMVRRARVIIPGYVHHVVHYGCGPRAVFGAAADYETYLRLLAEFTPKHGLSVWAWCLMPDHVRMVVVPGNETALGSVMRDVHACYAMYLNKCYDVSGPVWKDRFASCTVDDFLVLSAVRLLETLPVRAGLAGKAEEYAWSSAVAHCGLCDDALLARHFPPPGAVEDWSAWLNSPGEELVSEEHLLHHTKTGRPCGSKGFVDELESLTGRILHAQKRGPKPRKRHKQNT